MNEICEIRYHTNMKENSKFNKSMLRKLIVLGCLLLMLVLLLILRNYSDFCENYSKTVVQAYNFVFGKISSFFPFSIFELFLILTFAYALLWLFFFIRNTKKQGIRNSYHMIIRLLIVVTSILTIYQGTAGIEYGRKECDIPQHTKLIDNPEDYKNICLKFVDDFNYCVSKLEFAEDGSVIKPYGNDTLVEKLTLEYEKLDSNYFYYYTPKAKPMYFTSWLYRMLSITGVTFTPTGEANFNILNTDAFLPYTIAHEIAHTKGAMNEEDAQLTAAYICLNSEDPYIRFSGYDSTIWSLVSLVQATNVEGDVDEFYQRVDSRVYKNNAFVNAYWDKYGLMSKLADWINDLYLKANNDKGTVSYSDNIDVVQHEKEYVVNSYSRYQALYMWLYFDK